MDLCGRLVIEVDGRRHEGAVRGRQGRLLLAFLVLNRHAPVSRHRLAEAIWDDDAPSKPAGTLNTVLSGLRRSLGEDRLEGRRDVRLDLGQDAQVDVELAFIARDDALDALARSSFTEAADRAREAIAITGRDLLPGDHADWLERARRELRDVRADALEAMARAQVHLGGAELSGAVRAASELVELAPFRESGYAVLMDAQTASGNVAEALRTFDRVRTVLRDELGTAPAPQLLDQHRRLLALERGEVRAEVAAPATDPQLPLPSPLAGAAGLFVGRRADVDRIRAGVAAATAGERRFLAVAGDAGIGKTTLTAHVAQEAHAGGATLLYGRCSEEPLLPYEPFVDALCHLIVSSSPAAVTPEANPELDELGRWMPDLGRVVAQPHAVAAEPETRRFRMFEAMVDLLARMSRERPLVLVVDDLHWAEASTLRLLRHIGRSGRLRRVLVVLALRGTDSGDRQALEALLGDLRRDAELERIDLGGLDSGDVRDLIAASGVELEPTLAERVMEVTAGNPFFLGETLRALASSPGAHAEALPRIALSPAVKDMIARRLARLGPRGLEVLSTAAVLGPAFRLDVLEEVAPAGDPSVLAVLEEAVTIKLVSEVPGDVHAFTFEHALVREALFDSMTRIRRLRLHREIGRVLERRRDELRAPPSELAEHFFAARELGDAEPAVRYETEAGVRATEALAYEEAARHFQRALTALDLVADPDPDPAQRCDLLLAAGEAQQRSGDADARESFAEAAAVARGRLPDRLAHAAIGVAGRYSEAGVRDEELVALLEEALAELGDDDTAMRARVLARLAEALHFSGSTERALELASDALAIARRVGDDEALGAALSGRHVSLLHAAHARERLAVSAEMAEFAHRAGRPELLVLAHHARLYDLFEVGDVEGVRSAHAALRRLSAELRQPLFRHYVLSWAQVLSQIEGRFTDAEDLAVELLTLQQGLGARDADTVFAARLFAIRRDQGRLAELLPAVESFLERFPHFMPVQTALPMIVHASGDEERARHELKAVGRRIGEIPRDFFWLSAISWVAEAAATLRAPALIDELYPLLEPYADLTVQLGFAACLGSVERLLGLMSAARGDAAVASGHFRRALAHDGRLAGRALVTRTQAEFAVFLAESGAGADERLDAHELGTGALAASRELGMQALVACLEPHFGREAQERSDHASAGA